MKKLRIYGATYDETFEVTPDNEMERRVALTVELHNRDFIDDLWEIEVIEEKDGEK